MKRVDSSQQTSPVRFPTDIEVTHPSPRELEYRRGKSVAHTQYEIDQARALVQTLREELRRLGFTVPTNGLRDLKPNDDLRLLNGLESIKIKSQLTAHQLEAAVTRLEELECVPFDSSLHVTHWLNIPDHAMVVAVSLDDPLEGREALTLSRQRTLPHILVRPTRMTQQQNPSIVHELEGGTRGIDQGKQKLPSNVPSRE